MRVLHVFRAFLLLAATAVVVQGCTTVKTTYSSAFVDWVDIEPFVYELRDGTRNHWPTVAPEDYQVTHRTDGKVASSVALVLDDSFDSLIAQVRISEEGKNLANYTVDQRDNLRRALSLQLSESFETVTEPEESDYIVHVRVSDYTVDDIETVSVPVEVSESYWFAPDSTTEELDGDMRKDAMLKLSLGVEVTLQSRAGETLLTQQMDLEADPRIAYSLSVNSTAFLGATGLIVGTAQIKSSHKQAAVLLSIVGHVMLAQQFNNALSNRLAILF